MSWHWFTLESTAPSDALASARAYRPDGALEGFLVARPFSADRPKRSLGIDPRAVDPRGGSAWVSLALADPGHRVLFDDQAVSEALRVVLRGTWPAAMSTLTRDSATIAGALTAVRSHPTSEVLNDPFRRLFRTRLLHVEQGFIADMPSPVGPVIQRYSGSPWPWDRFEA